MRVDSHMHFWCFDPPEYSWIGPELEVLRQDRLPIEARRELDRYGIDTCVAVQARTSEKETGFLLDLARSYPWIRAVIGWTDLSDPGLSRRLECWGSEERLAGFRHVLQHDPLASALVSSLAFRRGVCALQSRSMVYELLITAHQLPFMFAFCRENARHWLVLDHLGKPDIRTGHLNAWRDQLKPIARLPHVVCKVSGILTEASDVRGAFDEAQVHDFLDVALDLFGPERLMFGSDWPVCLLVADYQSTAQVIERWAAKLSPSEREWIWGGTAARVYSLERST